VATIKRQIRASHGC